MTQQPRKVCFMTGGSGRLASQVACGLAQEGYDIFFTWHQSKARAEATLDELRRHAFGSAMTQCDMASVADIRRAFTEFREHFGRLDLLITAASNFFGTSLGEISEKEWDQLTDTNLKGTFFTMQEGMNLMKEQPFVSRIITITDISANLTWTGFAPYTASKAGVQHLTRIFAKACAPTILVNSIAPGTFTMNPDWNNEQDLEEELRHKIPLKRLGEPAELLSAIRFLAENSYMTGQVINIDGGRLLY
ncbi:SDR family NAD(P)-dependent oxidoreductase [Prosthecochloris sp. CIB 2401]|uniref:SDR family NAD(P)-dependent oxidoreductase n=1 Tax=Prosthecochloris sp. CIB 2401 TaxID=1868325 RepID=UPI00083B6043|nr:SDR family oxidoreductase [Prosthecochloris sp. CIB 2401]